LVQLSRDISEERDFPPTMHIACLPACASQCTSASGRKSPSVDCTTRGTCDLPSEVSRFDLVAALLRAWADSVDVDLAQLRTALKRGGDNRHATIGPHIGMHVFAGQALHVASAPASPAAARAADSTRCTSTT
jgi:hypothetical protein